MLPIIIQLRLVFESVLVYGDSSHFQCLNQFCSCKYLVTRQSEKPDSRHFTCFAVVVIGILSVKNVFVFLVTPCCSHGATLLVTCVMLSV